VTGQRAILAGTKDGGCSDWLAEALNEEQIREPVQPTVNPIAWLLWHIARA